MEHNTYGSTPEEVQFARTLFDLSHNPNCEGYEEDFSAYLRAIKEIMDFHIDLEEFD